MRIDGFSSSYSLDRSARQGSAPSAYREVQRDQELRREQPASTAASQGFELIPQPRRAEQPQASRETNQDLLPARAREYMDSYRPALSARASQALASYSSTAQLPSDPDAAEVLGLDLYA